MPIPSAPRVVFADWALRLYVAAKIDTSVGSCNSCNSIDTLWSSQHVDIQRHEYTGYAMLTQKRNKLLGKDLEISVLNRIFVADMKKLVLLLPLVLIAVFACTPERGVTTAESAAWEAQVRLDSALEYIDYQRYEQAMIQLKTAEKLLPSVKNDSLCYRICLYIGWMNEQAGAHQTAYEYEKMAKDYADRTHKLHYIINAMIHQVNTLNNMGKTDEGREVNDRAMSFLDSLEKGQQSTLLCNEAYYLMIEDSLAGAEQTAYQAAMLAEDSAAMGNALSVLSRIMLRKGDEQQAKVLMSMIPMTENLTLRYNRLMGESDLEEARGNYREALQTQKILRQMSDSIAKQQSALDLMRVQTQFDQQWHLRRSAERSFKLSLIIIFMLLAFGGLAYVYYRKQQSLLKDFQQRISDVRSDMNHLLIMRDLRVEDLKLALDDRMTEIEDMKKRLMPSYADDGMYLQIRELKQGVDVLHSIATRQNISQYGRQKQQAVLQALWVTDRQLASILDNPDIQLTPKETFFCIMEYYHLSDDEKLDLFCCTEQALRSTKSRLGKKLDMRQLTNDKNKRL